MTLLSVEFPGPVSTIPAPVKPEFPLTTPFVKVNVFLVVSGRLRMQVRDGDRDVGPGEFIIVRGGVEHCPKALTDEVHVLLLEPKTTVNTGNVVSKRTVALIKGAKKHVGRS